MTFRDPRFVVAYTIIVGFAVAYIHNPSDTMNGALIAAFAGAWGFYLGSSSGASEIRGQVGKALDLATNASGTTDQGGVAGKAAEKVAVAASDKADEIKGKKP